MPVRSRSQTCYNSRAKEESWTSISLKETLLWAQTDRSLNESCWGRGRGVHRDLELIVARSKKKIFFFWLQFGLKIRGYSIRRATVGIIAHVRYIKILTRLRGFLVIFLYILFCILCVQSLLWKLWDNGVVKKFAILSLKSRSNVRIYRTWASSNDLML